MDNQKDQNQNFSSQEIGNIIYKDGDQKLEGTLSAMSVFGKIVLILNGPTCNNMIIKAYSDKSYNAYIPSKFIYFNIPENLLDLIKVSE